MSVWPRYILYIAMGIFLVLTGAFYLKLLDNHVTSRATRQKMVLFGLGCLLITIGLITRLIIPFLLAACVCLYYAEKDLR